MGVKRIRSMGAGGAGSASDVDGGAGSGGDMSEGGKSKKLKLSPPAASSPNGTPQGSRSGSPTLLHASTSEAGATVKGRVQSSPAASLYDALAELGCGFVNQPSKCLQAQPESQPPDLPVNKASQPPQRFTLLYRHLVSLAKICLRSSIRGLEIPKKTIADSSPLSRMLASMGRRTGY
jgi:hypothetical protein